MSKMLLSRTDKWNIGATVSVLPSIKIAVASGRPRFEAKVLQSAS